MFAAPAVPLGTTATMTWSLMTTHDVAFVAPNLTPVVATVPVNPVPLIVTCWPTLAPDGVAELIDGADAGAYGFVIGVSLPSPERVIESSFRSATPVLDGVTSTMARPCHASSSPSVRYHRT